MANTAPETPPIPRPKSKLGQPIHGRQVGPTTVTDREMPAPAEYVANALAEMRRNLQDLVKVRVDDTKVFDQYLPQGLLGNSVSVITLQPSYEYTERVEAIIITGPPGNVTLQLGDRIWNLVIPAGNILIIATVAIYLSRSDTRQLSAASAGAYTLELMGHADARWSV